MNSSHKILDEDFVQKCLIAYLERQGWSKSLQSAELWEHGVDIKVRNNKFSRYWLIGKVEVISEGEWFEAN
ncbi:MAG: hypothetical protein BWY53_00124 [Parcubacteria group bacterium ADurb.Bin326]|nr:MAG: hypothetical protein BWY53_00124 [Parcubacteria group bacterium ADurb.Bin326]